MQNAMENTSDHLAEHESAHYKNFEEKPATTTRSFSKMLFLFLTLTCCVAMTLCLLYQLPTQDVNSEGEQVKALLHDSEDLMWTPWKGRSYKFSDFRDFTSLKSARKALPENQKYYIRVKEWPDYYLYFSHALSGYNVR